MTTLNQTKHTDDQARIISRVQVSEENLMSAARAAHREFLGNADPRAAQIQRLINGDEVEMGLGRPQLRALILAAGIRIGGKSGH